MTTIEQGLKWPYFAPEDEVMHCAPWMNAQTKTGRCGKIIGRKCDYNSQNVRSQCIRQAISNIEFTRVFGGHKCLMLGDEGQMQPYDTEGFPTNYNVVMF